MTQKPNFIVIGGMKCMTSTLHDQLALQPGICMSDPKEPNYFSDDDVYARGPQWYQSIWGEGQTSDLYGESSTHYTKLPTYPDTIDRLCQYCPNAKLIYVMRHPIDRLVSHYIHQWTMNVIDCPIDEAIDQFPELIAYSRYAYQLQPFIETYGTENILPVFFRRLRDHSQSELERICRYLEYPGQPQWRSLPASNVSSERIRDNAWRDRLVYAPGISWVRRNLVPRSVREQVKSWWRLRQRPQLSDASQRRLKAVFNDDLRLLSGWLGLSDALTCDDFRERTVSLTPSWKRPIQSLSTISEIR
ncbi:sulfotransferase family protein [Allorhodopirellula heiligendammensis]|uniref:Sulfotransferase domain protein n=1 Tax=Allorhodopirellula heiligendammensis TaxID=2714739 RepID=A0A5C6C1S1_9BACT|nr:sulfotransferase [Allorhodopirellula heiligendammensis]TWU18075.1 Sulfotransferase domain protein [Allorhodopirellula heiligendammensis]